MPDPDDLLDEIDGEPDDDIDPDEDQGETAVIYHDDDDGSLSEAEVDDLAAQFMDKVKAMVHMELAARDDAAMDRDANRAIVDICLAGISRLITTDPAKMVAGIQDEFRLVPVPRGTRRKLTRMVNDMTDTAIMGLAAERRAMGGES